MVPSAMGVDTLSVIVTLALQLFRVRVTHAGNTPDPNSPVGPGTLIGHSMREEQRLKNAKDNGKDQSEAPLALSWDALPDMAKNRWEEAVAFDVTVENHLAKAKADRSLAETERQRIAKEILDATKDVCKKIITDGQRGLNRAKKMETEAIKNHSDSQYELEQARAIRAETEGYREKILAEVDQEAREYIDLAKSTTDKECLTLRTQAAQEFQRILGQVEIMKTAIKVELETQKIYTDAARIKASSDELLAQLRKVTSDQDYLVGGEIDKDQLAFALDEAPVLEDASPEDVLSKEYGPELDVLELDSPPLDTPVSAATKSSNGKKSSRRSSNEG